MDIELEYIFIEKSLIKILYNLYKEKIDIGENFELFDANKYMKDIRLIYITTYFYYEPYYLYHIYVFKNTDKYIILIKHMYKDIIVKTLYKIISFENNCECNCYEKCDCEIINISFDKFETLLVIKGYMFYNKNNNIQVIDTVLSDNFIISRKIE